MPTISYIDFGGGLDRRLPINVQEASRLWTLKNAYITTGKKIRKRPAMKVISMELAGSEGLEAINGQLYVFKEVGSSFVNHTAGGVSINGITLDHPPSAPSTLTGVSYADMFNGFMYVVAEYSDVSFHHYVDGATTYITDVNCPHSRGITKAASRIFAPDGENVRYCAAGDARDWTTASDAGFLPAGLQQDTKDEVVACGTFQDALVVFFPEAVQIWDVAVDPTANQIRKRIYGVGSKEPLSGAGFASDLMFLSQYGFRSIVVQQNTDRIDDYDTGVPVDSLVVPDIASIQAIREATPYKSTFFVRGAWIPQLGQYWGIFNFADFQKAWVYNFSKTSKLACWSQYDLCSQITGIATLNGKVYMRGAAILYEIDPNQFYDFDVSFPIDIDVEVQMAFQDAKSPGVDKQFYGADFAFKGSPTVSFLYDPRDLTKETIPQTLSSDTRAGDLEPVEIVSPAVAPIFRHNANEEFEVDAVQLYFNLLRS